MAALYIVAQTGKQNFKCPSRGKQIKIWVRLGYIHKTEYHSAMKRNIPPIVYPT